MDDFDPRDPRAWRDLGEFLEDLTARTGRDVIRTAQVATPHQLLLATMMHPCGLSHAQVDRVQRSRREMGVVRWQGRPQPGWALVEDWREHLAVVVS